MRRRALLGGSLKNIETVVIPIDLSGQADAGSYSILLGISTRSGLMEIDFGDGAVINNTKTTDYFSLNGDITHDYLTKFVGEIKFTFFKGASDCFSICLYSGGAFRSDYKIQDFRDWVNQFPNLHSFRLNKTSPTVGDQLIGNLANIPAALKKLFIGSISLTAPLPFFNFSGLPVNSELEQLRIESSATLLVFGDFAELSELMKLIFISDTPNLSGMTYSTKSWPESFDTLYIGDKNALTAAEVDDILIDMADSILYSEGGQSINIRMASRTSASDAAVAYLKSIGFSVYGTKPFPANSEICHLPFDGNILNALANGFDFQYRLGGNSFVAGRNGAQCYKFTGNQIIWSVMALELGTDTVTIAFWFNSNGETISNMFFCDSGSVLNSNNAFSVRQDSTFNNNYIGVYDKGSGGTVNSGYGQPAINDSNWHHCLFVIDRSQNGANQNVIYIDGVLNYTSVTANDNDGEWLKMWFSIGGVGNGGNRLKGLMQDFHMYNYAFDATDVSDLYNDEL